VHAGAGESGEAEDGDSAAQVCAVFEQVHDQF